MLIALLLYIQKFSTKFSILSANCLPIKLYAQIVTILLILISLQLRYLILGVLI
jgi:hypothetical protein